MTFKTIIVKKEDSIATVTLNRPRRLNALNDQMIEELIVALDNLDRDDQVRVAIITGAGRAFCAGADLKPDEEGERILRETNPEVIRNSLRSGPQQLTRRMQSLGKPTIAMVNGDAVGGGCDLALACDLRVGSEKARFLVGFTRLGLIPGMGAMWLMPRIMGLAKAAELLFTGEALEAEEARRFGVLNRLVPAAELESETMALARKIASIPPVAVRLAKLQLYKGLELGFDTALEVAAATQTICFATEDHKEAIAAFRQKRAPTFRGK